MQLWTPWASAEGFHNYVCVKGGWSGRGKERRREKERERDGEGRRERERRGGRRERGGKREREGERKEKKSHRKVLKLKRGHMQKELRAESMQGLEPWDLGSLV